jgi:peptidoglycan/LPS O-acetylase OafA/YrhL
VTTGGTASRGHRADIQGLRAVAVLLVVLFHAELGFSGGFVGVDVFFVISGFVITAMLLTELRGTDTLRLARFYARRIRRLVPALALLIVVVALVGILAAPVGIQNVAARTGASASVFLGNFYLYFVPKGYFAAGSDLNPFLHTWSLAVEEQFYLVFPLVLLGAWKVGRRARRPDAYACGALVLLGLASFVLSYLLVHGHTLPGINDPLQFAFYSSPTRAWEFAAGAVLAFGQVRLRNMPRGLAVAASWIGIAIVLAVSLRYNATTLFPGTAAIAPVFGTMLLLAAGVGAPVGFGRVLAWSPLVRLGDMSYSWYLWHWPFIVFARALWPGSYALGLAAALSLIPAYLSFRFVENPIRFNPRLNVRRTLVLGGSFIAVGLIASGGLILGNRWVEGTDGFAHVRAAFDGSSACPGGKARVGVDGEGQLRVRCTWPTPNATATVALLGDSNARHIVPPMVHAARAEHADLYVGVDSGCPFVDVTIRISGFARADCKRFVASTMQVLDRMHPDVVVIGSSTNRYVNESKYTLQVNGSSAVASSRGAKLVAWRTGMHQIVQQLAAKGIRTIVVHPVPKYPGWDLRGCAAGHVVIDEFACGRSMTRGTAEEESEDLDRSEDAAVAGIPQAETVGFLAQVCTPTQCATDRGGVWLYTDGDHLSAKGALRLTPRFTRVLRGALAGSS